MKRILSLDVLRAVAVLLVLGCHVECLADYPVVLKPLIWGGGCGVDLFFVLSGFLVSGLLFEGQDWKRFLVRRGFKLYPSFWAFVAVTALFSGVDWRVAGELLFIQNYRPGLWGHTWSIAVEEHFYLTLPFFLMLLPRRWVTFAALASTGLCLELRCLELPTIDLLDPAQVQHHMQQTHLRFDALLLGVALRHWFASEAIIGFCRQHAIWLGTAGVMLLMPLFALPQSHVIWQIAWLTTFKSLGSACLVAALVARGVPDNHLTRGLGFIGKHSYSVYLWHPLALMVPGVGWAAVVAYLVVSLVAGVQLSRCIEQPMLTLRDRLGTGPRHEACRNVMGSVVRTA
jgi:peptidoglycan/LPS O-acetylase OafA/YrhL